MRVIAIRGKNLASLAGEFEIHFQQEPLASAGLFAICGPTGSGKSTLLDALCLALYDETPRLTRAAVKGVSLPDVGDETITPQDPRNLLRRGAGEGWAEVDFVGNDGVAYRARWSVRRARSKVGGKLQHTEMSLETFDGAQRIGGVKSEVQQAIRERLGLSFDQFTRAVLLAQNEFAAFLKADNDERGHLLQTLTGLDVYTGISIRAFDRAKAEQQVLETLRGQLDGQQPFSVEARAQREQERNTAQTEMTVLAQRKEELSRRLQWYEVWEKLKQDEQQARAEAQKMLAARETAAPRQLYFAQVEAVQGARSHLAEMDRIAGEIAKNRQEMSGAEEKLGAARQVRQQADEALAKARQTVVDAEEARITASPDLDLAKALEAEIRILAPGHAAALDARNAALDVEKKAQQTLASKQAERQQIAQNLQTAQDWLATHEPLRLLAEDWLRWDVLLGEAAKAQTNGREVEQKVVAGQQAVQNQRQTLDTASGDWTKAEQAFQAADGQLQSAMQALSKFDAETLAERRKTAENRRDRLAEAESLWMALDGGCARQRQLEHESRAIQKQIHQAEIALTRILADQPAATARLEQAEKSLKIAEAACAENIETLRETLEAGLPCPVCGATEHPYVGGDAPSRALLTRLGDAVDECRKTLNALNEQEATHKTQLGNSRQRRADIATELQPLMDSIQRNAVAWNAQPVAAELAVVAPADRLAWFANPQRVIGESLTAIEQEEKALRQAAKVQEKAQTAWNQAQQQHSIARDTLNAAQAALKQAAQTLNAAQERKADFACQLEERLIHLDAAFSDYDWRPRWQTDPIAFHEQRRRKVAKWSDQSRKAEQWQNQIGALDSEIRNQTETIAEKVAQRQRAAEAFQNIDRDLQAKRRQRQGVFSGRPVAEVDAAFAKAIAAAKTAFQDQEGKAKTAANRQASAEAVFEQAGQALISSQQKAEQVDATLNRWLADFNAHHTGAMLDSLRLRTLLAHDSDWLIREREALLELDNAVKTAEAILKERQLQRDAHEQRRTSPDSAEVARAAQQQLALDLDAANSRHKEAEIALRQDDERRAKTELLQTDIAKQEAKAEIWRKLDALIGSADGKKFRNYAQQFTLDVLLSYANHHLNDLSRRYRLERVKDTLALMVVDQDMGDEFRSVHSLSGGESFLVSLALALGLASLSSNRVRVESLFIDEGFGSLDADTLRIAMDALDHLQAQGRKVGVISHVQEMSERIGIQIRVQRQSGGQSRVEVRSFQ
ncbi:AAA family ATPase [Candidatus Contendibacter odensensis]|uniref:Nuclease SbcCD subunit C n=1 Tax=Candidatus Contendobacter odensis Run_B_J11 TaxID=1400861 RepID=A0A7U7GES0_9GAMM|nr:AAA family ATPase [Candidatus Contendobacter odensis]CDH46924.1 putative Exonuclease SbcC [Candidatus Contendobacter odensis Run_B_J11]